jgi:spore maturation protein CgeB
VPQAYPEGSELKLAIVGTDAPGSLASCLANGSRSLGHESVVVSADRLVSGWRPLILGRRFSGEDLVAWPLFRQLVSRLTRVQPDVILVVKGRFITAHAVDRLRAALRCPVINYYPDHPLWPGHSDGRLVDSLAAYDEVIVWAAHVAESLREHDVSQTRVIPFAYDPDVYRPAPEPVDAKWEVSLIGQCYPVRLEYAEAFADRNLFVSGLGWSSAASGRPLANRVADRSFTGTTTCRLYWSSAVSLNILSDWNYPAHNMRTFEIPAAGTVMVATRTPEHVDLLGEDGAVLVSNPKEARNAVLDLLFDPDRRRRIASLGRSRIAPHTYARRMAEVLEPWRR